MNAPRPAILQSLRRYDERLARRIDRLKSTSDRLSSLRLGIFLGGAVLAYLVYRIFGDAAGGLLLVGLAVAFIVAARQQGRVERSLIRHRAWRALKQTHRARMELDWSHLPPPAIPVPDFTHPFEADLNLTGDRSLMRLLDTTATPGGHRQLSAWLREDVVDAVEVERRQRLVRGLQSSSLFRDRLALEAQLLEKEEGVRSESDLAHLVQYRHDAPTGLVLAGISGMAALNWVLLALDLLDVAGTLWVYSFQAYAAVYIGQYRRLVGLFDRAEELYYTLRRYAALFGRIERHRFQDEEVRRLVAPFHDDQNPPSRLLRASARIAAGAGTQKSELLTLVLNALGPWDLYFAHRLEAVKEQLRVELPRWLDAWHELEVLNALAGYAAMHPEASFPSLRTDASDLLDARGMGHPLIPDENKVRNDLRIADEGEICLMTGSNMSGKSTFLRTVGINLVLARIGAPVDAARFAWRPVRIFSCLQVSDSVNDGISYFYAEVKRLRALLEAAREPSPVPLLFLIDEIFRGTNNRERLIGSRAYIKSLAREHAAGLIATHDLELVTLEEEIPSIRNLHFREEVHAGRMVFDYRLRSGPSPTTNALQIMKMEGLPVEDF